MDNRILLIEQNCLELYHNRKKEGMLLTIVERQIFLNYEYLIELIIVGSKLFFTHL